MSASPARIALALACAAVPATAQVLDFERVDLHPGDDPRVVAAADVDLDGLQDLVVLLGAPARVVLLRGLGGGAFAPPAAIGPSGPDPRGLVVRDLDGDLLPDVATASFGTDDVRVLRNLGAGAFAALPGAPVLPNPLGLVGSDLDQDGDVDLATPNGGNTSISVLRSTGSATFQLLPVALGPFLTASDLAPADLDVDGDPDLAVGLSSAWSLLSLLGTPGTIAFQPLESPLTAGTSHRVAAGLVTGDAVPDVVITADDLGDFETSLFPGLGNGGVSFAPTALYACCFEALPSFGDLDGSAFPDLVLASVEAPSPNPSLVRVRLGTGTALVGAGSAHLPGLASSLPGAVAVADLSQDGSGDVVVACSGVDVVALYLQRAPVAPTITGSTPATLASLSPSPQTITLTGDGFTTFQSWKLDGVVVFGGGVVLSDDELQLTLPAPTIGMPFSTSVTIEITTAHGTASTSVPLAPPGTPTVVTNGFALSKEHTPAEIYRGGSPGDLTFLAAAPDTNPSSLPGIVQLGIGSQFQTLVDLGPATLLGAGWSLTQVPIGTLPTGLPAHFQLAVLPAGGTLPLVTSGVLSLVVTL